MLWHSAPGLTTVFCCNLHGFIVSSVWVSLSRAGTICTLPQTLCHELSLQTSMQRPSAVRHCCRSMAMLSLAELMTMGMTSNALTLRFLKCPVAHCGSRSNSPVAHLTCITFVCDVQSPLQILIHTNHHMPYWFLSTFSCPTKRLWPKLTQLNLMSSWAL